MGLTKSIKIAGGMKPEIESLAPENKAIKVNNSTAEYVRLLMSNSKYFGEFIAFENANIELKENEIIGIVGENGAGKSTLLKC